MASRDQFETAAQAQRQLPQPERRPGLHFQDLIRLGTLAASSHNTQPWRVHLEDTALRILPDFTRRCAVVDPDDSHLFKSLGCMAQNIEVAAQAQGYLTHVSFDTASSVLRLDFDAAASAGETELYGAIVERQCTKLAYDGKALTSQHRRALEQAGAGKHVRMLLLDARNKMESILEFVTRGNRAQLSDPAFKKELAAWVRFNPGAALKQRDGLAGHLSGQPSLPQWLGPLILNRVLTPKRQSDTDAAHIRSAGAVAVFVAASDTPPAWVETGRVYERFALRATALGIRNAFINQPIEVRQLRPELNTWLDLEAGEQAMLMVRLGYGPKAAFSLRRPVNDILIETES